MNKIFNNPWLHGTALILLLFLCCSCDNFDPDTLKFSPHVSAPTVTAISATHATLGGTVGPVFGQTTSIINSVGVSFEWVEANDDPFFVGGEFSKTVNIPRTDAGPFTVEVTGLVPGRKYRFWALAEGNDGDLGYSETLTFTTLAFEVTDPVSSNVTTTSATLGGTVASDANGTMTERGVIFMPLDDFDELEFEEDGIDNLVIDGPGVTKIAASGTGLGAFTVNATTGITPRVSYVFKAYARIGTGPTAETVYSDYDFFGGDGDTYLDVDGTSISGIAALPDGKTLIGGNFTAVDGVNRSDLVRLNADGTVDSSFTVTASEFFGGGSWVQTFAVQNDGKVLMGGLFNVLNGASTHPNLARLNANGTIDTGFLGRVAFGNIECIAIQPDGKILLGGYLINVNGHDRYYHLGRLNPDGSLDTTFDPGPDVYDPNSGPDSLVKSIAVLPGGKILIGGWFNSYGGTPRNGIALLNEDGSLVGTFNPGIEASSFAVQSDGRILVGGSFPGLGDGIARIDQNGVKDPTFFPTGAPQHVLATDGPVESIAIQANGKIVIGGAFTDVNGTPRAGLARLESNGTIDATFDPGFGYAVAGVALREDGKIVVGGSDPAAAPGFPEELIAVLENEPATSLVDQTSVTRVRWVRGGSAPEVPGVIFEASPDNGISWSVLGPGWRYSDGWELISFSFPANNAIRARARTSGGSYNSSSGLVERSTLSPATGGNVPTLENPPAPGVSSTTATLEGEVKDVGGSEIIDRGFVFSRTFDNANPRLDGAMVSRQRVPVPTEEDTPDDAPRGLGTFTTNLARLVIGTSYSFRAYATNANGTGYSPVVKFVTQGAPKIGLPTASGITDTGATLGGSIVGTGSSAILERGVLYRVSNPNIQQDRLATTQDYVKVPEGGTSIGAFAVAVSGLAPGTAYDFAAYARNIHGTTYTNPPSTFTTTGAAPIGPEEGPDGGALTESGPQEAPGDPPGMLDASHDVDVSADGLVQAIAIQPDGKAILAGDFTSVGGGRHLGLARLNGDGSVDPNFTTEINGLVYSVAVQPDGKILLGGAFDRVNGNSLYGIARLEADGSVEIPTSFSPGAGADNIVFAVALQPDGKILLGGLFTTIQGASRKGVARLNSDGSLDTTFDPGAGADDAVYSVAIQPDGRILIGGAFENVAGTARNRIARLNADGSHDSTFNPGSGADNRVTGVSLQPDGKVLLGGYFTTINGTGRNRIARILATGAIDTSFDPGSGANDHVYTLALQADGKLFVGGLFQTINGTARNRIARLNANGSVDTSFDPGMGADAEVDAVALQEDGRILIGGLFQFVDGIARNGVARLENDLATQSLTVIDGTHLTWMRGGAAPEILPVNFEISTDAGTTWTALGAGTRVADGWSITGQDLPLNGMIRALGRTSGGFLGGSAGIVEESVGYDHQARIAALRAQLAAATANVATLQKQIKAAKKKKNAAKVKKLNKSLATAMAQISKANSDLAKY